MVAMESVVAALVLSLIIVGSIGGNVLVVCAIRSDRTLHSPANFLICSLAVTDLLVACLVMPFSALYQILGSWIFGNAFCEIWTATDIACCTASILHLCAIALERHQSITNAVHYFSERMRRTVAPKIAIVWMLAFCISIPPILGWKPSRHTQDYDITNQNVSSINKTLKHTKQCKVGHYPEYTVYATLGSFYIPLALLLVVYTRIYILIHQHIKRSESRSRIISCSSEDRNSLSIRSKQSPPNRLFSWRRGNRDQRLRETYSWRMGNVYHYNISKRGSDPRKRTPTQKNCGTQKLRGPTCENESQSSKFLSLSSEDPKCGAEFCHSLNYYSQRPVWGNLRASTKRRSFQRRQMALTDDQISDFESERRSAPPCIQYSIKKCSLDDDHEMCKNFTPDKALKTKQKFATKSRSESDIAKLAKQRLSDDVIAVTSHRRRTHTAGHVHFAERHDIKLNSSSSEHLTSQKSSKDDVFCASSATSSRSSQDTCFKNGCCFPKDKKVFTRQVSQISNSSPMLVHSLSMRAKIKVLKAREIRAIRTLGTIVGAFVFCWLPFFVVTLAAPFCTCSMPPALLSVVLWLGYCNSLVNPMLYAAFNRDFHSAFKRLFQKLRQRFHA